MISEDNYLTRLFKLIKRMDENIKMPAVAGQTLGGKTRTRQSYKDDVFVNAGVKATNGL